MRLLLSALSLVGLLALPGHVHGQYGSAQASAQIGGDVYAAPQAALQMSPVFDTSCAVGAADVGVGCGYQAAALLATPVYQNVVVQRQVVAQPVYLQRQIVQQQVGYGIQNQALAQANVGYGVGVGANIGVNRGLVRARGVGAQRTVVKSKAVTRTGRAGLLNRVLGR